MKQSYITVSLVFCLQFGFGQIGFQDHLISSDTYAPIGAKMALSADIDGDGDLDIVSASTSDDTITIHENIDGQGTFRLRFLTTSAIDVLAIEVTDMDGNGDIDVVAVSGSADRLTWYRNLDGNGNFSSAIMIDTNINYPVSVKSADLDGDGDQDLVVASAGDSKIGWYENIGGQAIFSSIKDITLLTENIYAIDIVDIDGDGDHDVLSASVNDDKIAWYENLDGLGNFGSQQIIENLDRANAISSGDLDGDGDIDVVSGSGAFGADKTISWYKNTDGIGTFGLPQIIVSSTASYGGSIEVVDLDGDTDLDLLIFSPSDSTMFWRENTNGLGDFSVEHIITTSTIFRHVSADDMDNDGDIDILATSSTEQKIEWYENNDGFGNFNSGINTNDFPESPEAVYVADMDGDGDNDILATSKGDKELVWFKNLDGQGYFSAQIVITDDPGIVAYAYQNNIIAVDIDGDGDLDVANMAQTRLAWYENDDGLGTSFTQHIIEDVVVGGTTITGSDLDGDGDIDLLVSKRNDESISDTLWYENTDGNGTFIAQNIIRSSSEYTAVFSSAYDFDNDGDMDALLVNENERKLSMYKNLDGQGSFGPEILINDEGGAYQAAYGGDIDLDGDLDILLSQGQGIFWLENLDGLGGFGPPITVTDIYAQYGDTCYLADLDNDGDLDVVMARSGPNNRVAWYENIDGLGTFGVQQIISEQSSNSRALHFGDIDGDGDLDPVSASWYDGNIIWHENLGIVRNQIRGYVRLKPSEEACDISSYPFANMMVVSTSGSETVANFTSHTGLYQLFPNEGGYETSVTSQLPTYYESNPNSYTSNFTGIGYLDIVDFCIEPIANKNDLNISVYPSTNEPRPGFDTSYRLVYRNIGTTQLSGSVSFEFDNSKLNFLNASETIASQTTNILTFDFTDLNPFETRTIDLSFNVFPPPTTNIDDELVAIATVNPVSGDETEGDNVFTLEQTVIGSYDPNDITVLEGDEISIEEANKYLHYLIRFQNTGTASAIKVRVEHVLDDKLDWTTMQLESLSHTGRVEIVNETNVSFIFNSIYLPDSTTDEPNSHGYIAFKIKPKSDVAIGDVISGIADIFFDFNPAIITNTVNTEIVAPLSVNEFNVQSIQVFPNPGQNVLKVVSNQVIDKLTIIDINGRVLNSIDISNLEYSLDISSFLEGVYFIKVDSGDTESTKKFIKN
ncbi:T9SS type A sorting domain-containing protein [Winogradskyella thalassocola]|uniref:Por secretion system C-terminal sorting domain-containing protein n=1 Tax=Winogradskyella thalassocola TaxID=262004 RepID=A0A1G8KNM9_9FLAO|nr:T9SS type A sorting domain-containing protein [Winogradskyella thalassocola]SDI45065.1 Por secretion system C-terminal sorting domain-containing protein [Winogradskyella thalassocola]